MRILFFIAGILLLGTIYILNSGSSQSEDNPESSDTSPRTSKRTTSTRSESPEKSLRYLKSIPAMDVNNPLPFSEIQRRTRDLSLEEIQALLAEHTSHYSTTGWLRSALWAELGHRNHRQSFDELLANLDGKDPGTAAFANDQAAFAFLRGRSESLTSIDGANSVFEDINTLAAGTQSRHWQSRTIAHLFKKLASIDHQAAWELTQKSPLTETEHAGHIGLIGLIDTSQTSALNGFFHSLPSEKLARQYLEKWQPALETPEARKAYQTYQTQLNSRSSGFIVTPPNETIISHALSALARFDPDAATEWLTKHQADPEKPDYNRAHSVWRQLATHHPDDALEIFSRPENIDIRRSSIGWLIENDYSLLPDIISQTDNARHQSQIIQSILSSSGSDHVKDFFPTPEGPNRLPNFQQRHKFLLEAINLGTYPERQREIHLKSLAREFKSKLSPDE